MSNFEKRLYSGEPTPDDIDVLKFLGEAFKGVTVEHLISVGFQSQRIQKLVGANALLPKFSEG